MLARQMVDVPKMKQQIELWESSRRKVVYAGEFREIAGRANGALFLFPPSLLSALKRRGVEIHQNVLSGFCANVLRDLERNKDTAIVKDEYRVENAKRVLTSLYAILQVNPAQAFLEPAAAKRSGKLIRPCLLVVRKDRLEVRSAAEPRQIVAALPAELDLLGGEFVQLGGRTVVIAYNHESVFAWEPGGTEGAFIEFSVGSSYGINHVAHRLVDGKLDSVVLTTDGPVYRLTDLARPVSQLPRPGGCFHHAVVLRDGRVFAIQEGPFSVAEISSHGEAGYVITGDALDEWVWGFAADNPALQERLHVDERLRGRKLTQVTSRYQNASISRCEWRDEEYLVLRICLDLLPVDLDLILLYRLTGKHLEPAGHYECPARMIGYSVVPFRIHGLRVFVALLSHFDRKRDLLLWARSVPTTRGLLFVQEGSTMRIHDDLVGIGIQDDNSGFAYDDSGGLFRFWTVDINYEEVDRDTESRIRALHVLS